MVVLDVSGIGCGSCVGKITRAIQALDNNATVSVDRSTGKVSVESSENAEQLRKAVEAVGFPSKISR
ncbi:cation transporter [Pseudomonas capsici]|jgi:copper chaperone|uniref:heavy-metal-associated domain-containing protein n=1 Tax=Pseudomonas TaxID=286 RepID=UPI000C149BA9|nr:MULTISPECIES: heavy-metal-associated domain-containing protein [Pseudomonas]MBN6717270.1 cation transporter [Pseudomonas capsici]MBN6722295.1 cation transporter [Pseudomonas capsici]MBN6727232.1 cation transporter [Pseudomonas capsici]